MENTNCLEGMRCPRCQKLGKMEIAITALALVSDEGTETINDTEWNEDSFCRCDECDYCGTVKEFLIKNWGFNELVREVDETEEG